MALAIALTERYKKISYLLILSLVLKN